MLFSFLVRVSSHNPPTIHTWCTTYPTNHLEIRYSYPCIKSNQINPDQFRSVSWVTTIYPSWAKMATNGPYIRLGRDSMRPSKVLGIKKKKIKKYETMQKQKKKIALREDLRMLRILRPSSSSPLEPSSSGVSKHWAAWNKLR